MGIRAEDRLVEGEGVDVREALVDGVGPGIVDSDASLLRSRMSRNAAEQSSLHTGESSHSTKKRDGNGGTHGWLGGVAAR